MGEQKLILFDIDGTLIKGVKGHLEAFRIAFKEVYSVDVEVNLKKAHGKTDLQIILETLIPTGLNEDFIKSKLNKCIEVMNNYYKTIIKNEKIILLNGVLELLQKLKSRGYILGLVTGNLEPIAREKLKRVGLNNYFSFGGFGNENFERANLVKIAINKAESNFKLNFDKKDIFLFGDTPLDVLTGKKVGVKTVGVATGFYSLEELKKYGADYLLNSLANINKVLEILEN